jgi:hypothetical protein
VLRDLVLRGSLVDAQGSAALDAEAWVELLGARRRTDRHQLRLDAAGRFDLMVDAAGFRGWRLEARRPGSAELRREGTIGALGELVNLGTLRLEAGPVVRGRLVSPAVASWSGWHVFAHEEAAGTPLWPRITPSVRVDRQSGAFALPGLQPGAIRISAFHPVLGLCIEQEIQAVAGGDSYVELSYDGPDPAGCIAITVVGGDDLPAGSVTAERGGVVLVLQPLTGQPGVFRACDLPEGEHVLSIRAAGGQELWSRSSARRGSSFDCRLERESPWARHPVGD